MMILPPESAALIVVDITPRARVFVLLNFESWLIVW